MYVCLCHKGTEGGLLVYMYLPLCEREDEQKAASRDREEMDEVGDVCTHAALFVRSIYQDHSGTVRVHV